MTDLDYMDLALREAEDAFTRGDWPVGSVVVRDGGVLATGQNRQVTERDVTWHAEFDAIRRVTQQHGYEKLAGATVYSTMEPCPMCASAMMLAKVARLVLGTRHATLQRTDLGTYAVESFCALTGYDLALTTGVREAECTALRRRWGKDAVRR
jgi:tRNA(adenine34) deaminase